MNFYADNFITRWARLYYEIMTPHNDLTNSVLYTKECESYTEYYFVHCLMDSKLTLN